MQFFLTFFSSKILEKKVFNGHHKNIKEECEIVKLKTEVI